MADPVDDVAAHLCGQLGYSLEAALGAGAYKHAYLVSRDGKQFALKVGLIAQKSSEERFAREAKALLACRHPAIAVLHSVDNYVVGGLRLSVMIEEYLAGGTLKDVQASGNKQPDLIKHVGRVMAGVLQHLHDQRFVHRDIKPANILFRAAHEPVLTDFGIVRILGEPSLTHDFMMQGPGTPFYAAPEQLLNQKAQIDWRTDQFDLSLVLAEWLLGRHPFLPAGGTPQDAVVAVAQRSSLPTNVCKRLQDAGFGFLVRGLAPWNFQRYRDPADFLHSFG